MRKTKSSILVILAVGLYICHHILASYLVVVKNRGVSFGCNLPMIEVVTLLLLAGILIKVVKKFDWGLYMVFLGGLINFSDRLFLGFVRDYFNLKVFYNNLADWVIFAGISVYIIKNWYATNKNNL